MTQDLTLSQNKEYRSWVKELKQRYLSARLIQVRSEEIQQHIAAPAILYNLTDKEKSLFRITFTLINYPSLMVPGDLQVGEKEIFIDLLFYNTRIHAYCCVELKTGSFEASHLGQLGLYVTAVNHQLKTVKCRLEGKKYQSSLFSDKCSRVDSICSIDGRELFISLGPH